MAQGLGGHLLRLLPASKWGLRQLCNTCNMQQQNFNCAWHSIFQSRRAAGRGRESGRITCNWLSNVHEQRWQYNLYNHKSVACCNMQPGLLCLCCFSCLPHLPHAFATCCQLELRSTDWRQPAQPSRSPQSGGIAHPSDKLMVTARSLKVGKGTLPSLPPSALSSAARQVCQTLSSSPSRRRGFGFRVGVADW